MSNGKRFRFYDYQRKHLKRLLMPNGIIISDEEVFFMENLVATGGNETKEEEAPPTNEGEQSQGGEPETDAATGLPLTSPPTPDEGAAPVPKMADRIRSLVPTNPVEQTLENSKSEHKMFVDALRRQSQATQKLNLLGNDIAYRRGAILGAATEILAARIVSNPDLSLHQRIHDAVDLAESLVDEVHKRHDPKPLFEEAKRINNLTDDEAMAEFADPAEGVTAAPASEA